MDRETFLSRAKGATKAIKLSDGTSISLKKLSQADVEVMNKQYQGAEKALEGLRFVVCQSLVDDHGALLLKPDDLNELAKLDYDTIQEIALASLEFSGLNVPKNT